MHAFLSVTAALNPHSHALYAKCNTEAGLAADTRRVALEAFQANLAAEVDITTADGHARFACAIGMALRQPNALAS